MLPITNYELICGKKLKNYRLQLRSKLRPGKKMPQSELAELASTSSRTVQDIERNHTKQVQPLTLENLSKALSVGQQDLQPDETTCRTFHDGNDACKNCVNASMVGESEHTSPMYDAGRQHVVDLKTLPPASNLTPEMRLIPGGRFSWRSPIEEEGRERDEHPHEDVVEPFLLAAHPVTVGQFRLFCKEFGCVYMTEGERAGSYGPTESGWEFRRDFNWRTPGFKQEDDNQPVTCLTIKEAMDYCEWLSAKTGKLCGLPTEVQWEFACRGRMLPSGVVEITTDPYHFGKRITPADANYRSSKKKGTTIVGSYPANGFCLFDMHGNVREMCDGWYRREYAEGVVRGGSWTQHALDCRAAFRVRNPTGERSADIGFRVCQSHSGG